MVGAKAKPHPRIPKLRAQSREPPTVGSLLPKSSSIVGQLKVTLWEYIGMDYDNQNCQRLPVLLSYVEPGTYEVHEVPVRETLQAAVKMHMSET